MSGSGDCAAGTRPHKHLQPATTVRLHSQRVYMLPSGTSATQRTMAHFRSLDNSRDGLNRSPAFSSSSATASSAAAAVPDSTTNGTVRRMPEHACGGSVGVCSGQQKAGHERIHPLTSAVEGIRIRGGLLTLTWLHWMDGWLVGACLSLCAGIKGHGQGRRVDLFEAASLAVSTASQSPCPTPAERWPPGWPRLSECCTSLRHPISASTTCTHEPSTLCRSG